MNDGSFKLHENIQLARDPWNMNHFVMHGVARLNVKLGIFFLITSIILMFIGK